MTRQYWSHHAKHEGLITTNSHIAALLINNFNQPEIPLDNYVPYQNWKHWLKLQQIIDRTKRIQEERLNRTGKVVISKIGDPYP